MFPCIKAQAQFYFLVLTKTKYLFWVGPVFNQIQIVVKCRHCNSKHGEPLCSVGEGLALEFCNTMYFVYHISPSINCSI